MSRHSGAALVTGASSGIGEAFAEVLAARGQDLILVARREDRLQAIAERLGEAHGVQVQVVAADLADPTAVDQLRASVSQPVGLLVNNAGIGQFGPFESLTADAALRTVDLNCRAPVALTYAFLPEMIERGSGGVIFVASMAAYQPVPNFATYSATKAFGLIFAESLWAELRDQGVDVLALCPGFVHTGFHEANDALAQPIRGTVLSATQVAESALRALGRQPSVLPGFMNKLLVATQRFVPRSVVARIGKFYNAPTTRD